MPVVLCVESIHPVGMKLLAEGTDMKIASNPADETVIAEGQDAKAIVVRLTKVSESLMKSMPSLRFIGRHGIGVDNIDVAAATRLGIVVVNVPGEMALSVAEHTVSMFLCLQKRLLESDQKIRQNRYGLRDKLRGKEVSGKTVGLIGVGRTGKLVASMCKQGFGMRVIGYDPYLPPDVAKSILDVEMKPSLADVLQEADMVSIHVPLTPETRNLFCTETFKIMKRGAVLVNVARGGIVNEGDLFTALTDGTLAGAGLDVFDAEPPDAMNPLFKLDNVVLTPHNAGMTAESVQRMSTTLAKDILRAVNGQPPVNMVNSEIWASKEQ